MLRGSVTASLIGYVLLMHVKEFGQLLIGISSLLEKISRGLYYERMKLSYLCTAEYPTINRVPLHTAFHHHPHHPYMTEVLINEVNHYSYMTLMFFPLSV